jgi:hypothetical protein
VSLPPSLFLPIALSLAFPFLSFALIQSFVTRRVGIEGSNLQMTRPVLSSCYLSMAAVCFSSTVAFSSACSFSCIPLLILPHNREFVTSGLDIGGSDLLVIRPVIYPCSVAVSSFLLVIATS